MENYEYIIVGAGIAGSVLANKIANEKNKKVLIIGNEGLGISSGVKKNSDVVVGIPMKGKINLDKAKQYINEISNISMFLLTFLCSIAILYFRNIASIFGKPCPAFSSLFWISISSCVCILSLYFLAFIQSLI